MYGILEKLMAFILEGIRDSPQQEGAPTRSGAAKRFYSILLLALLFFTTISWTYFEHQNKLKVEEWKVREATLKQDLKHIALANGKVVAEASELRAQKVSLANQVRVLEAMKLELKERISELEMELERADELAEGRLAIINTLRQQLVSCEKKLDEIAQTADAVWDEFRKLGDGQ